MNEDEKRLLDAVHADPQLKNTILAILKEQKSPCVSPETQL